MVEEGKTVYFDSQFVAVINDLENSRYSQIISLVIENISYEIDHEKLANMNKIFNSIFSVEKSPLIFYRKLKSLVHCCVYNRFSKKFKNDLLGLGFKQDKLDILCDLVKIDIENLNEKLKNSGLNSYLKDFSINTEMPVSYTSYEVSSKDSKNVDYKKQYLNINFSVHEENDKEIFFNMNKGQLLNFYEEIEKIQEKLDKLY